MHAITVLGAVHWRIDLLNVLILLCISKPHRIQAGPNTSVANHKHAWTQSCKNGGYCYFMHLCPVVIRKLFQCQSTGTSILR